MLDHYRVDADHSNAYETWKKLGSPPVPTRQQYAQLKEQGGWRACPRRSGLRRRAKP